MTHTQSLNRFARTVERKAVPPLHQPRGMGPSVRRVPLALAMSANALSRPVGNRHLVGFCVDVDRVDDPDTEVL